MKEYGFNITIDVDGEEKISYDISVVPNVGDIIHVNHVDDFGEMTEYSVIVKGREFTIVSDRIIPNDEGTGSSTIEEVFCWLRCKKCNGEITND